MLGTKIIQKIRKLNNDSDFYSVEVFKALGDLNRYRIFHILAEYPRLSVGNIAKILDISIPLASVHIKLLTQTKLISKEKIGKKVYLKLDARNSLVKTFLQIIILGK